MLKIILSIFLVLSCCLSAPASEFDVLLEKAHKSNKEILRFIELLETRPLITSISLEKGIFSLSRKDFKYNPGKYLGDIKNSLNERLPDEDNGYFDLGDTMNKYKKANDNIKIECLTSYVNSLENLEQFLSTTWEIEKNLRDFLGISEKKFENSTIIEATPIGNSDSIFPQIKLEIPVVASGRNFIKTMIKFITERVTIKPIIEKKRKDRKKENKKRLPDDDWYKRW